MSTDVGATGQSLILINSHKCDDAHQYDTVVVARRIK
jgi:hypothetical protein